jgi:lipopolysaccharide transport system ATP-binding protein
VTILFVSHAVSDVKAIGDRVLWLDHGRVVEVGEPERVISKYLAAMTEKDSAYLHHKADTQEKQLRAPVIAPEIVEHIPSVDHRYGDGRAEVIGIAVLDDRGEPLHILNPSTRIIVRVSVRAKNEVAVPMVGFMLRNQLGIDFSGTNTAREGYELPPMEAGDVYTVDFHIELPELYPASFSFSPAIADGTLAGYTMCDWIDNALALQMTRSDGEVYGYLRLPCRVEVNARLGAGPAPVLEKRVG